MHRIEETVGVLLRTHDEKELARAAGNLADVGKELRLRILLEAAIVHGAHHPYDLRPRSVVVGATCLHATPQGVAGREIPARCRLVDDGDPR